MLNEYFTVLILLIFRVEVATFFLPLPKVAQVGLSCTHKKAISWNILGRHFCHMNIIKSSYHHTIIKAKKMLSYSYKFAFRPSPFMTCIIYTGIIEACLHTCNASWILDTCIMDTYIMDTFIIDTCIMDTCIVERPKGAKDEVKRPEGTPARNWGPRAP